MTRTNKQVRKFRKHLNNKGYNPFTNAVGLIMTPPLRYMWWLQKGFCYSCLRCFCDHRHVTREHVTPKSLGGGKGNANVLLACKLCNSLKRDRPPNPRELALLEAKNWGRVDLFRRLMMSLDDQSPVP